MHELVEHEALAEDRGCVQGRRDRLDPAFGRWSQDRRSVLAPLQAPSSLKRAKRECDRGSASRGEAPQDIVSQRQGQDYPVRGHATAAFGQLPEHQQHSILCSREVRRQSLDREALALGLESLVDDCQQGWPARCSDDERPVQSEEDDVGQRGQFDAAAQGAGLFTQRRHEDVVATQELEHVVVAKRDLAGQQTIYDHQTEDAVSLSRRGGHLRLAASHVQDAADTRVSSQLPLVVA